MADKQPLTGRLSVRVSTEQEQALQDAATKTGMEAADLMREMLDALGDGRLRIIKRKNQLITIKGVHIDA